MTREEIINYLESCKNSTSDTLWESWIQWVSISLFLEGKFEKECKLAGKEILVNIEENLLKENLLEWCLKTYGVYHKLRNAVETLDSIEEIRIYLKNNPQ